MNTFFLFISGGETIFVLFIVVMIFGTDKLPEIARSLGKGMTQLKNATNEIKSEITRSANEFDGGIVTKLKDDITKTIDDATIDTKFVKDVKSEIDSVKKDLGKLDDLKGPIKRLF